MCWFDLIWDFCVCVCLEIDSRNVSSRHNLNLHNTNSGHLGCFRRSYPFSPSKSAKLSTEQRTPKQKILGALVWSASKKNDETSLCYLCTPYLCPQHSNKNLHTFPTHHSSCFSTTATKIHCCSNFLRHTKTLLPYIHHSPTKQQYNNQQQQFFIIIINNNNQ